MVKDFAAHCNAGFFPPTVVAPGYFGYVGYRHVFMGVLGFRPVRPKPVVSNKGIRRENSDHRCT
jgi:hypothetical protein